MRLTREFTVAEAADYIEELLDNDSLPLCDKVDIFITSPDNDVQTDEDSGSEDSDGNINNLNSRQLAAQAEIQVRSLEDEDEEEWIESRASLDDIVINEVTDQETDDIIFQVEDLKVGDYILALFVSTGKRAVVHYKYVAKILQVLESDDFEVQCLKSLDETKTTF
ncbi:hypothetical protein FQA39_LY02846 [Lamprigera yunnana]|nr:hypothetical protein FQA39_LY02846 [Lamprigera yunnana]